MFSVLIYIVQQQGDGNFLKLTFSFYAGAHEVQASRTNVLSIRNSLRPPPARLLSCKPRPRAAFLGAGGGPYLEAAVMVAWLQNPTQTYKEHYSYLLQHIEVKLTWSYICILNPIYIPPNTSPKILVLDKVFKKSFGIS